MATPSNRVPVRVARGTKANLDAAMALGDLKEGEIVYATDEDGLYVVESGALVGAATAGAVTIDDLTDVDTSTVSPTGGDVLVWSDADSEWQPGEGGVSSLAALTDTTISSPAAGDALVYDGVAWVEQALTVGSINDTVLTYLSGGTSIGTWDTLSAGDPAAQGEWKVESFNELKIYFTNAEAVGVETEFNALPASGTIWLISDGDITSKQAVTYTGKVNATTFGRLTGTNIDDTYSSGKTSIEFYTEEPTLIQPIEGSLLSYSVANSDWRAVNPSSSVAAINDLTDVNTASNPPDNGDILVYNTANSEWETGTPAAAGASALGQLTDVNTVSYTEYDGVTKTAFSADAGSTRFNYGSARVQIKSYSENGLTLTDDDVPGIGDVVEVSADGGSTWIDSVTITSITYVPSDGDPPGSGSYAIFDFNHDGAVDWPDGVGGLDKTVAGTDIWFRWQAAIENGKSLVYNATSSLWEPGDDLVQSVNGATGPVVITTTDLPDVGLAKYPIYKYEDNFSCNATTSAANNPGGGARYLSDKAYILNVTDSYGNSIGQRFIDEGWEATDTDVSVWFSKDSGATWVQYTKTATMSGTGANTVSLIDTGNNEFVDCGIDNSWFTFDDPATRVPLADKDILQYNSAEGEYNPTPLTATSVRELLTIGEYADDTAATTDGVSAGSLYYDTTNSDYRSTPFTAAFARGILGIGEYADDTAAGVGGVASGSLYYNTTASDYRLKA